MQESELSKNTARRIQALKLKKNRDDWGQFSLEGSKSVLDLLADPNAVVTDIVALPDWLDIHGKLLHGRPSLHIHVAKGDDMRQIAAFKTPSPVLAIGKFTPSPLPESIDDWVLFLSGIRDPGNLGTLLRIADWFGLQAVFCSPDCVDIYNQKTLQASMGSFLRIPGFEMSFEEFIAKYPDCPIIAADMDGDSIYEAKLPIYGALLVGNEGRGIETALLASAAATISIPGTHSKGAESLNAAVATAIILGNIRFRTKLTSF
ncbi:MAG: RNA methyltransferase [Saprospiraceae bacterium]